jgi:hypothetical protein
MEEVKHRLMICADSLRVCKEPITSTYLMWELMNWISDDELVEWDITIIDVAEEVEHYCNAI